MNNHTKENKFERQYTYKFKHMPKNKPEEDFGDCLEQLIALYPEKQRLCHSMPGYLKLKKYYLTYFTKN